MDHFSGSTDVVCGGGVGGAGGAVAILARAALTLAAARAWATSISPGSPASQVSQ